MANEREAVVLSELRNAASELHLAIYKVLELRDRFNALGGTAGFQGASKLFAADGSGQVIPFSDFIGEFNSIGALEGTVGTPAAAWSAMIANTARVRG